MSDFDLPDGFTPPAPNVYATYLPHRSPKWKFYANIGYAKNAINAGWGSANTPDFLLLELINGQWVVKYRVKPGTPREKMPWNDPNYKVSETPRADRIKFLEGKITGLREELAKAEIELDDILNG